MKKASITALVLAVAMSAGTAYAAEIPKESAPENATAESIAVTENLIGWVLDDVQNGLGYADAWARANNAIYKAVLEGRTSGYGYADLAAIARNAIFQCRDRYLRPDYYAEQETALRVLLADLITAVQNGKPYDEAKAEAYIRIYQSINPAYVPDTTIDTIYRDVPAVDGAAFSIARKLLLEAAGSQIQNG